MDKKKGDKEKERKKVLVEVMRVVHWGLMRNCRSIKEEKNARFRSGGPESVLYYTGKGSGTRIYDVSAHPDALWWTFRFDCQLNSVHAALQSS